MEHNITVTVNADKSYFDPSNTMSSEEYEEAMLRLEEYIELVIYDSSYEDEENVVSWFFNLDYINSSMNVTCRCSYDNCPIVKRVKKSWSNDKKIFDIMFGE